MVFFEHLEPFLQNRELSARGEGDAGAEAFATFAAAREQRDGTDAVIEEFVQQFVTAHAGIGHREIEAVGQLLVTVLVIDDDFSMTKLLRYILDVIRASLLVLKIGQVFVLGLSVMKSEVWSVYIRFGSRRWSNRVK